MPYLELWLKLSQAGRRKVRLFHGSPQAGTGGTSYTEALVPGTKPYTVGTWRCHQSHGWASHHVTPLGSLPSSVGLKPSPTPCGGRLCMLGALALEGSQTCRQATATATAEVANLSLATKVT